MSKPHFDVVEFVQIASDAERSPAVRRSAFAPLMEHHQNMVYGCALSILGDAQLAEDAAQEAFIAAWQNLDRLRQPAAFPGWLRRIVLWQCYRLKRVRQDTSLSLEDIEAIPNTATDCPQQELERTEARHAVSLAISRLPTTQRLPVVLFYMGGYSHGEIAEFLEISTSTVKKRIFDARQKLKTSLPQHLGLDLTPLAPSRNDRFKGRIMKWIQPDNLNSDYGTHGTLIWDMLLAVAQGNLKQVESLLRQEPSLAAREFAYYTPLHFAVREGHRKIVQLLLEQGADATYKSGLGWQESPVEIARDRGLVSITEMMEKHLFHKFSISPSGQEICDAARNGDLEKINAFLNHEPNLIKAADERGNTALHWAVMTRHLDLIELLMEQGADAEAARTDGAKPVHLCIHGDYWHRRKTCLVRDDSVILGFLLAKGAVIDAGIEAHLGDYERLQRRIAIDEKAANAPNSYGYRPLSYAARRGYTDIVKLLLEAGASPIAPETGAVGGLAFYEAVANNHVECAKLLLEAGADPQAAVESSGNPLMRALSNKNQELIDLLYMRGAMGEMYHFLSEGRYDVVGEVLKANPALVNTGGDYGFLCMTAAFAPLEMVRLVLSYQPDLNRPWYANNYIGYVLSSGRPDRMEVLKMLLEAGTNPNLSNWVGVTYLHKVAMAGSVEVAQMLLDYGADLEVLDDEYCSTPLGWAAQWGRQEMVEFLLSRGTQAFSSDAPAWATPLIRAQKKGYSEIVKILERHELESRQQQ